MAESYRHQDSRNGKATCTAAAAGHAQRQGQRPQPANGDQTDILYAVAEKLLIAVRLQLKMEQKPFWSEYQLTNIGQISKFEGKPAQQPVMVKAEVEQLKLAWQVVAKEYGVPPSAESCWREMMGGRRFFDAVVHSSGFQLTVSKLHLAADQHFVGNRAVHKKHFLELVQLNEALSAKLQLDRYDSGHSHN